LPNLSSHSLRGIKVISIVAIGLIAFFLGELGFFFSSLAFQFLFYHHIFLLEALVHIDFCSLPFQEQLKKACGFLPLMICACLPSFEHFITKQT
jgi:hypothetical protein